MRGTAEATRQRLLEAAYDLFYAEGFGRVGIDRVAEAAGVTKRTLYYHFDSKDTLLAAVLDHQHALALSRIAEWAEPLAAADLGQFLDALFAALERWSRERRWTGAGMTRLVMELADLPGHPARAVAARHKAAIEDWLTTAFERHGAAAPRAGARTVMLLLEGTQAMMLISGDRSYAATAAAAARRMILGT
ncbi:TetR family transcriptional regulator [Aliidongia dinghuensis]|uniref:TetR family transcriptional regulator n=1 Tax=Aliidongia dinghuensis TaxID=1867774 RepID=A0A8J2YY70_9PROT|nr:TetR/AcrR family transcriptional regulator [Aliidongia dinghuensis]GGF37107.1 TetR family transcriptional regulator [Aliidongia dinghuensis]